MKKRRWSSDDIPSQEGRVAIVTGANSGIGMEAARALAVHGALVIMACRDKKRGEEAAFSIRTVHPGAQVRVMELDLADLASVRAFAAAVIADYSRLDLLIDNAGVMIPPFSMTKDGFELQFGTNHLGHFALTSRLLPVIRSTPASRIVVVSSVAHFTGWIDFADPNWKSRGYHAWAAYSQSKLANLLFAAELQRRLDALGASLPVIAVHPGWTNSNLQRTAGLMRWFNPVFGMPPWQGALPTLYAATSPAARGGAYYGPDAWFGLRGYPGPARRSPAARNAKKALRLWNLSCDLTGERFSSLSS